MPVTLAMLEERTVLPFDYSGMSDALAEQARDAAKAINKITSRHVRLIGKHLLAAKAALPHGSFTPWVESELGMTARTAQNYMGAVRWLDGKPESVSLLPDTVIYALASPTAPAAVVEEIVEEVARGTPPDSKIIAHRIEVAKAEAKEVKRLVAAKPDRTEQDAQKVVARSRQARAQRRETVAADWQRQADERRDRQQNYEDSLRQMLNTRGPAAAVMLKQIGEMVGEDSYGFIAALKNLMAEMEAGR